MALSFALSPLWLGVYFSHNFGIDLWGWRMGVFVSITGFIALMIMRFAPGGDGTISAVIAVRFSCSRFVFDICF